MKNISFNVPPKTGKEEECIRKAIESRHICGDGEFTKLCSSFLEKDTGAKRVLLTTSGTHTLELAAHLCDLQSGDEVILPSYTFSSTANAFALEGATLVFVDVDPKTMNISPEAIEQAITDKTKVICAVHYAGVGCDMDRICDIASRYGLMLVEDAAQAVCADYKGKRLGTFGTFGCYSFHETKNYSMGEGGALLINDASYIERAEIMREKGTDRSLFLRGQVDKYTWRDIGSSYLPSELNAAYLWPQLEMFREINENRLASWNRYYKALSRLSEKGKIELPYVPSECSHNAHMFYIKTKSLGERTSLSAFLKERGILAVFHYVPLHSAAAGRKYGRFNGEDLYTTSESERLLRLPMYYGLEPADIDWIVNSIYDFYANN